MLILRGDGELHNSAQSVQMWCVLQILAAKLFETWVMVIERFLQSNPPDVVGRLEPAHQASLTWLIDYFGKGQPFKDSALKIIRDKTAFHYDRLNLTEAADNLAAGENSIYLAQHPANSLYYMGSVLVFRAAFAMIADKADAAANDSHEGRVHKGTKIALDDASKANWHMHALLYGLIKLLMDDVLGQPAENEQQVRPSPAHRYFQPRGCSRLRFFPWHRRPGSHVPYKSQIELRAAYMPDAAWAVSVHPQANPVTLAVHGLGIFELGWKYSGS